MFRPAGGAQVGGDFYDLFPVTAFTWAVVIGDVCGKGPLAASRSTLARYSLRGAAVHGDSPAATLHRVNQAILAGDDLDEDSFCTLVFAIDRPQFECGSTSVSPLAVTHSHRAAGRWDGHGGWTPRVDRRDR